MIKPMLSGIMLFCLLYLAACKNHPAVTTKINTPDTTVFYPLQAYFFQQMLNVSDTNTIYKLEIINGRKDSLQISKKTFDTLASQITAAITTQFNNTNYKEAVFHDESTNSNTINYTALNKSLPVQSINILLDPVDQQVKRVFFNKYTQTNDSTVMQNFGWKNDNSFYINTSVVLKDNTQIDKQLIVVWRKEI